MTPQRLLCSDVEESSLKHFQQKLNSMRLFGVFLFHFAVEKKTQTEASRLKNGNVEFIEFNEDSLTRMLDYIVYVSSL